MTGLADVVCPDVSSPCSTSILCWWVTVAPMRD
jgi:hypothetical protein